MDAEILEAGELALDLDACRALIAVRVEDAEEVGAPAQLARIEGLVGVGVELLQQALDLDPGRQEEELGTPRGPFGARQDVATIALEPEGGLEQPHAPIPVRVQSSPFGIGEHELARGHAPIA